MSHDAQSPKEQAVTVGTDYAILFGILKGDLDLALQFARIGNFTAARQHLNAAESRLRQLEACPKSSQPVPEVPAIDV